MEYEQRVIENIIAVSIIEDNPILAEIIEYHKPSRIWEYKVFFREIAKQYPPGYVVI